VWRIKDSQGAALADVLALDSADDAEIIELGYRYRFWHPSADYRHFYHITEWEPQPLLKKCIADGKACGSRPSLNEIRAHSAADLETFDSSYKRLLNPHVYKVSITEKLRDFKLELIKSHLGDL